MAVIFDGKASAQDKEEKLRLKVENLKEKGIVPKLVSIIVGDDPASHLYVNLKKKAAERIGCELLVVNCKSEASINEIVGKIKEFNEDSSIHGIMIQLPLPDDLKNNTKDAINTINLSKDVDGLRDDSKFIHPTVKAILEIIEEARKFVKTSLKTDPLNVVVVGGTGMVGRPLVRELKKFNYNIEICNSKTSDLAKFTKRGDVLISVTGVPGIIKKDMVKEGAVLIDVGSPKGDIEKAAYEKALFVSPVPGGVGPVTILCLLENLVIASY